ncbi:MAG: PDZ domain-containing protein [Actinomycetota bacterium]|nr:PDZ domain-containing protein [Actinomycetota bacterium]
MSSPKHLWSGDWERDSASAEADRANHPAPPPAEPIELAPSPPAPPSAAARTLAAARGLGGRFDDLRPPRLTRPQRRMALLVALAALVVAGGAVALSSSGGSGAGAVNASTPWLGLQMESLPVGRVLVAAVVPGSPAARAGVGVGDLVLGINGKTVSSPGDVDSTLAGLRKGDRVKLQIGRGPLTFTLPATLTAHPASYP